MDPFSQFVEVAGWPKSLDLIGRKRLLSLWTYSCQPAPELRAPVFDKLTSLLSMQEAQDWDEEEWMEVVLAVRTGSTDEKGRLADVISHYVHRPEVSNRLVIALFQRETNGSSADPQVKRSLNLGSEPGNSSGPAPDSTAKSGEEVQVHLSSGSGGTDSTDDLLNEIEIEDSDSNEPRPSTSRKAVVNDVQLNNSSSLPLTPARSRARRSVSGNSGNKRKIPEQVVSARARRSVSCNSRKKRKMPDEDAHVSGRNAKSPRPQLKRYSGVVQLSVSDIQETILIDGCIKVDMEKWDTIMRGCQSSAKIILPEGSFSFPPRSNLWPNRPGVTISGTSPEKTTICYHPPSASSAKPKEEKETPPTVIEEEGPGTVILFLCNKLTFENLTVMAKYPQEDICPRVELRGDKCQVQNVTFRGCGLGIESNSNVVDNLRFYGEVETAADSRLPTKERSEGILIWTPAGSRSGNIVKNIYIQDLVYGIWNEKRNPRSKTTDHGMADLIENVTCQNVKFGVKLTECLGVTVKNLTWRWDWKAKEEVRTKKPSAVKIHGGHENVVSGITCQCHENGDFYGFVLNDEEDSGVPKKSKISDVKGASGRYWDDGEETELVDVHG